MVIAGRLPTRSGRNSQAASSIPPSARTLTVSFEAMIILLAGKANLLTSARRSAIIKYDRSSLISQGMQMNSQPAAKRGPKPKPDTYDNLVQAGLRLLHAEGYAATGIQSIVESVNVPKGSFYNHFASKEAFGAEGMDASFDG